MIRTNWRRFLAGWCGIRPSVGGMSSPQNASSRDSARLSETSRPASPRPRFARWRIGERLASHLLPASLTRKLAWMFLLPDRPLMSISLHRDEGDHAQRWRPCAHLSAALRHWCQEQGARGAMECAIVASASPWKASISRIAEAVAGNGTSGSPLARNARLAVQRNDSAASEAAKLEAILARAVSRT